MRALAILISFSMGLLSLSQEIVWIRIVGFAYAGKPQAFAYVLVMFLTGIALGAMIGKKICEKFNNIVGIAGWSLLAAGLIDLSVLIFLPDIFHMQVSWLRLGVLSAVIIITASGKAVLFPVVHQMGSLLNERLGRSVSSVYFANIAGSTIGSLMTGIVVLEWLSSENALILIAGCTLLLAAFTLFLVKSSRSLFIKFACVTTTILSLGVLVSIDKNSTALIYAITGAQPGSIRYLVENRHGIIHVVQGTHDADRVFGGNVYDGHTTTDLKSNINGIDRTYLLHALSPAPKQVLVIGLATGAWVKVLTMNPLIERIDVIEINPGYLQIIPNYPELKTILDDPRVHIHIADGRHYLRTTDDKYDLILMNTTWYWRAYATNLLSENFQQIVKSKLNPGGLLSFNSTWSGDVFYTASQVFKYTFRFGNFIYASEVNLLPNIKHAPERLLALSVNGQPVFDPNSKDVLDALNTLTNHPVESIEDVIAKSPRPLEVITDQNMIVEFKHGIRFGRKFGAE